MIRYLIVSSIFLSAWVYRIYGSDFYLSYILMLSFLPFLFYKTNYKVSTGFILILLLFSIFGLLNIFLGNNSLLNLIKQLIGITLSGFFYYSAVRYYGVERLFRVYFNLCVVVAFIGLIQYLSYHLGINVLYDFREILPRWRLEIEGNLIRINSILPEPSHFAIVVIPAVFVSIYKVFFPKYNDLGVVNWKAWLLIASYLLSFSFLGYLGISIAIVLIFAARIRFVHIAIFLLSIVLIFSIMYKTSLPFKDRINGLKYTFVDGKINQSTNLSAYTFYNNATVSIRNIQHHPLVGTGLGSHPYIFDRYRLDGPFQSHSLNLLNRNDANSLFLRIVSEQGIFGLFFLVYFLFHYKINTKSFFFNFWLINSASLILILLKLTREGHYFVNGFMFFLFLYVFSYKEHNAELFKDLK